MVGGNQASASGRKSVQINTLSLQNFFSFKHASINLANRGLLLVEGENRDTSGSNGAGKSSLFEAMLFCLFGITRRYGSKRTKVTRNWEGDCLVYMEIEVVDQILKVYRYQDHTQYGNKVLAFLDEHALTKGSNEETQKEINAVLQLDAESFQSVVLYPQDAQGFASLSDSGQKYILESVLGMQRFADAHDRAKEQKKFYEDSHSKLKVVISTTHRGISERKLKLESLREKENKFEQEKQTKVSNIQAAINHFLSNKPFYDDTLVSQHQALSSSITSADVSKARQLFAQSSKRIQELEAEKASISGKIQLLESQLKTVPTEEPLLPELSTSNYEADVRRLEQRIKVFEAQIETETRTFQALEKAIGSIDGMKFCDRCGQNLTTQARDFMYGSRDKDRSASLERLSEFTKLLKDLQSEHQIQEGFFYCAKLHDAWEESELSRIKVSSLKSEVDKCMSRLGVLQETQRGFKEIVDAAEISARKIDELKSAIEKQERELASWEKEKIRLDESMAEALKAVSPYKPMIDEEVGQLLTQQRMLMSNLALSDEIEDNIAKYAYWVSGFSNGGLKSLLLDTVTPLLNEKVKEYIETLSNGVAQIQFSTQSKLASGEIREKFNVEVQYLNGAPEYKGCSGGETARIDIACLFALGDLAASRAKAPVRLRLLDEPFENLDRTGQEQIIHLLKSKIVPSSRTVLVVSHDQTLQALFDQRITVVKENGVSTLEEN